MNPTKDKRKGKYRGQKDAQRIRVSSTLQDPNDNMDDVQKVDEAKSVANEVGSLSMRDLFDLGL